MDTIDVDDGKWTATAFGVCTRVLKVVPKLDQVAGIAKTTILEKCTSPYLASVRSLKFLAGTKLT